MLKEILENINKCFIVTVSNVKECKLKNIKEIISGEIHELKTDKFYFNVCKMDKSEIIEYISTKLNLSEDNIEVTNENFNEESELQKTFREFFKEMLKKFGVDSPAKLTKEQKVDFFNAIALFWQNGKGPKEDPKKIPKKYICSDC